jgi:hypothetical protein
LHYPHYSTMYVHDPSDPHKRRHETIRSIYLWSVPPEKRAEKPKNSTEHQSHFEKKYRSMLKDRADHEWSRKYYYPRDDYGKAAETPSRKAERHETRIKDDSISSSSRAYSSTSTVVPSYTSTRSYTKETKETRVEEDSERKRSNRTKVDHPVLEASKSARRLDRYLAIPESSSSTSRVNRTARTSRRSEETTQHEEIVVATSSSSSSNGTSSRPQLETSTSNGQARNSKHSRVSSSSSSSSSSATVSENGSIDKTPIEHHVVEALQAPVALVESLSDPAIAEVLEPEPESVSENVVGSVEDATIDKPVTDEIAATVDDQVLEPSEAVAEAVEEAVEEVVESEFAVEASILVEPEDNVEVSVEVDVPSE